MTLKTALGGMCRPAGRCGEQEALMPPLGAAAGEQKPLGSSSKTGGEPGSGGGIPLSGRDFSIPWNPDLSFIKAQLMPFRLFGGDHALMTFFRASASGLSCLCRIWGLGLSLCP